MRLIKTLLVLRSRFELIIPLFSMFRFAISCNLSAHSSSLWFAGLLFVVNGLGWTLWCLFSCPHEVHQFRVLPLHHSQQVPRRPLRGRPWKPHASRQPIQRFHCEPERRRFVRSSPRPPRQAQTTKAVDASLAKQLRGTFREQ